MHTHTVEHITHARRLYRPAAPAAASRTALRGVCIALAWRAFRRAAAEARGPRWVITADRVVELAAWDIVGRCWRTEAHELHPGVALYQTPEAALRVSGKTSCSGPMSPAADRSPAAAPSWLTREWTWSTGLASIALRLGAGRCCTVRREDGSISHHIPWHMLDAVCFAPAPATCTNTAAFAPDPKDIRP